MRRLPRPRRRLGQEARRQAAGQRHLQPAKEAHPPLQQPRVQELPKLVLRQVHRAAQAAVVLVEALLPQAAVQAARDPWAVRPQAAVLLVETLLPQAAAQAAVVLVDALRPQAAVVLVDAVRPQAAVLLVGALLPQAAVQAAVVLVDALRPQAAALAAGRGLKSCC